MKTTYILIITIFSLLLSGCFLESSDDNTDDTETITDLVSADENFSTLLAALEATGLDNLLSEQEDVSFTVFAPTNEAFAKLGEDTIAALLDDPDALSDILTYHVSLEVLDTEAAFAASGSTIPTGSGGSVGISSIDGANFGTLFVNQATVVSGAIEADNGVIYAIDAVLTRPPTPDNPTSNIVETAIAAGNFTTLVSALEATGLDDVLSDEAEEFTVFAPTDDAFAMLGAETINTLLDNPTVLSDILLQHVVPGTVNSSVAYSLQGASPETASGATIPLLLNADTDLLTFGGANVITTDIFTSNGVIHVIDMVVVADVTLPSPPESIVEVATQAGNFNTLIAALEATGLDTTLGDLDDEFTVFAPTDAAFALLGQDTIDALLIDTDTLSNILLYHVLPDASVLQDAAVTLAQSSDSLITMANDAQAALSLSGSTLYVNTSAVSSTDIMADNGVIHVIDQVILPLSVKDEPTQSIAEVVVANADFETLLAALQAADLDGTLGDETQSFTVFAPTDAAFDKIDDMVLSALLNDVDALTDVLLQHVVGDSEISSLEAFAANGANLDTLANEDVSVALVNFTQAVDDATTEVAYDAINQRLIGGQGSSSPGFTAYVFDNDLGTSGSACNDTCATNWPPILVTDDSVSSIPGLSTIERDDGSLQAAYQGRPLYFFSGDSAAGDITGEGVNDVWWVVNQAPVSLQIQGANVTTTDIYTTNGVIHVIDTVITETLSNP